MQEIILDDISRWDIVGCRLKQSSRADHLLARLHICMDVSRRRRRVQNEREIIVIITINSLSLLSSERGLFLSPILTEQMRIKS